MKKVLLAAAVALSYGTAYAGMYHSGPTNICADCHTMHASMAHDFTGATPVSTTPKSFSTGSWLANQGAPAARLLKGSETDVCIACHDGLTWAPDVLGALNANANVRSAGYIPTLTATAADNAKGHTMEWAGGLVPGSATKSFTVGSEFTCASCHSPHGKAEAFRNLNAYSLYGSNTEYPRFVLSATPFTATPSGVVADVRINATYTMGDMSNTGYYANSKVIYENGGANKLDTYCGKCHGLFHDETNGANQAFSTNQSSEPTVPAHFKRHPTNNLIGRPANSTSPSYTTKVYASSTAAAGYVGCLSCHKAHGTNNPFNLFFSTAATTGANVLDDTESGSSGQYGSLCSNCHGQAR